MSHETNQGEHKLSKNHHGTKIENNKTKVIYIYKHINGYVHIFSPSFIEVTETTQELQKADLQDKRGAGNNTLSTPIEGCCTTCSTKEK